MAFEEIFMFLPLLSSSFTHHIAGDPARRGGDLGSLMIIGFAFVLLFLGSILIWTLYALINRIEKATTHLQSPSCQERETSKPTNSREFLRTLSVGPL